MARSRSRPASPLVLAIDIGTSSVRTALFDAQARLRRASKASRSYRLRHSADHAAELDPAILLRATRDCLRRTQSCLTKSEKPILAGSGFWHSLLGVDEGGEPLTPIYTWADNRPAADAARLREEMDERVVQQRTGCMLRASFWPAKLLWLRRTEARLFHRVNRWVSPAEWLFEKLFGSGACSHSMASGTGLYNLARRTWDQDLLKRVGLTTQRLGVLADHVEARDSLVFTAIGDGAAGNLGSGATAPRTVAINVGTSAAVRVISPDRTSLPFGLFRFRVDERRSVLGGAISNAGNLRAWCLRELRLPNDVCRLEKLLRAEGRGAAGLTVLPFWVGERAPSWPENSSGALVGLSQATTAAEVFAAAIAASFHRLAQILELLENAIGRAKRIIVSGGILQSTAAVQLLADSLGRNLEVCADQDASLRGATVHALEGLGLTVGPPKFGQPVWCNRGRARDLRVQRARQEALEAQLANWNEEMPQSDVSVK